MDRRAVFFVGAAVVCALLVPVTEQEHRWLTASLVVVYLLLALGSWADRRNRARPADARAERRAHARVEHGSESA